VVAQQITTIQKAQQQRVSLRHRPPTAMPPLHHCTTSATLQLPHCRREVRYSGLPGPAFLISQGYGTVSYPSLGSKQAKLWQVKDPTSQCLWKVPGISLSTNLDQDSKGSYSGDKN
jgi:hypothetical protein